MGHTEDLGYLFDFGYEGTDLDYLIRKRYVRLITNFVKTRNPTPIKDSLLLNLEWPANRRSSDIKQLNITSAFTILTNPNKDNMNFWTSTFEKSGFPPFNTY